MFHQLKVLLPLVALIFLSGCGGGGGGSSSGSNTQPPVDQPPVAQPPVAQPPADQSPGGLWIGRIALNDEEIPGDFVGLSTEDGKFYFFSLESEYNFSGTLQVNGNDLTGEGYAYSPPGTPWQDAGTVTPFSLSASINERSSINGSWSANSGDAGAITLNYDSDYDRGSHTDLLVGIWAGYDQDANPVVTFDIWDTGEFQGQNVSGCVSVGEISPNDSNTNIYEISSTISNCTIAGSYQGLGALVETQGPDDTLVFAISNEEMAIVLVLSSPPREAHNIITVDGKEWLQPDLFTNLSWNDISAVCPPPEGICAGRLNGYSMTGWTWASIDDINALFNSYQKAGKAILEDFAYTGTDRSMLIIEAMLSEPPYEHPEGDRVYLALVLGQPHDDVIHDIVTGGRPSQRSNRIGAWLWRPSD